MKVHQYIPQSDGNTSLIEYEISCDIVKFELHLRSYERFTLDDVKECFEINVKGALDESNSKENLDDYLIIESEHLESDNHEELKTYLVEVKNNEELTTAINSFDPKYFNYKIQWDDLCFKNAYSLSKGLVCEKVIRH